MSVRDRDLPVLSDGLVVMRPFGATDADALVEIWRDPAIRLRNTVPEPTVEAATAWIAARVGDPAPHDVWEWALADTATQSLAGRRALKGIDWRTGRAEAASRVAPQFRGRQFAARSLRLAAEYAFARGLVRIQAACEVDNEASQRSLQSAGMRHEGTLRSFFVSNDGRHVDAEMYSLLAHDLTHAPAFRTS